jgi:hypothetical protein
MKGLGSILLVLAATALGPALVHAQSEPSERATAFPSSSETRGTQTTIPVQAAQSDSAEPVVVKVNVSRTSPKPDGLPVYGAIPESPKPQLDVAPTVWGRYRVSNRPSQQIEHVHHVISAGYLR